ncbi:retention module-containing protein [Pseudomonas alcaligenes]|uniref:retention module-containing protein n=1 Tax=Aquipseudomonas alcaligenes TaxID=43263 RepID=UPI00358E6A65
MATLIGVVSQVVGEVFAVAGDGTRRPLVEGDRVYAGEQLVTGAGGAVAVTLTNGEVLTLGRDSSLNLNEQMLAGGDGQTAQPQEQESAAPSDSDLTDVEQLQAAIEAGVDPTLEGEATAAGPGAGGGGGAGGVGGGHSFVLLGEVGGALDPVIGFPTAGFNTGPEFPEAEPIVDPDPAPVAPDSTPTVEVEYEDASGNIVVGPAIVDEEALADGTNPGSSAEQASGTIVITSPDGVSSLQIQGFNGVWVDVTNGGVVVGQYGILTVDAAGNWTYTLTNNTLDHSNPNASGAADQVGESFPVRVFDLDGDVSPTVLLNVLVNDDAPILTEGEGALVSAIVDEDETSDGIGDGDAVTNVASGGPGTLNALVNFGADGIGSFGMNGSPTAIASLEAQGLTSGGTALSYTVVGNVLTASAGAETIFTLQIGGNGSFTFTLIGQLDHPVTDGNDNELLELPIDFSGLLSATDGDGDSVGTFNPGSFVIDVEDDVPVLIGRGDGEEEFYPSVWDIVHEDALTTADGAPHDGNPEGGQTTTVGGPAGSLSALVNFGADGPGEFGLSSDLSSMELQGLTSGGVALSYSLVGNVLTASAGGETIFTLTVNGDGSWEFVLEGPIDHPIPDGTFDSEDLPGLGVDFSGILTATDGDGDPLVGGFPPGSFAVDIEDDVPILANGEGEGISGVVHEDALQVVNGAPHEGNPDGLGQTTVVSSATAGSLSGLVSFGADGPGSFGLSGDLSSLDLQALESGGVALTYGVVGNVLTASAGGETIFTLTVNADGSWQFVLEGPIDHPVEDGTLDGELLPGLGIDFSGVLTVTDGDGDPLVGGFPAGSFTVNVEDDVPRPDQDGEDRILHEVQEDALTLGGGSPYEGNDEGGQVTTASGAPGDLFALIDFGADGPGTVGLSTDVSSLELQGLESGGVALTYGVVGNVLTASAGGETIFTLTVNADGSWEFVLEGPIDHPIADSTLDDETLPGVGIDFSQMLTATDGDGDPMVIAVPSDSFAIDVEDDVPVPREVVRQPWVSNQVDEDNLPDGIDDLDATGTVAVGAAGALHAAISFGADGPGSIGMSGSPAAIASLEAQGLTSGGVALSYSVVGDLLTAMAGPDTIFTLQVNGDGSYTFTLLGPLDHPVADGTPAGDNELLGSPIDFSALITATDGDGDPLSGLNPGSFVIQVEDDIPVAKPLQYDNEQNPIPLVSAEVDEDELPGGISDGDGEGTSVSGGAGALHALVDFGADGPGDFGLSGDPLDIATLEAQGLTSDGTPLSYAVVGNVLTASVGGDTIFTLTVNPDGSYDFVLSGPLDHPLPGSTDDDQLLGLPIDFSGVLTATDGDGDPVDGFADGSFVINVEDDVPEAQDDHATVLAGQTQDINMVFVLDFSGSISNGELNTMLDAVRTAGQQLFASANGAVQIQIVVFSESALSFGPFANEADFTSQINALNPSEPGGVRPNTIGNGTDFTDAIEEVMDEYDPLSGWSNQVVFISDGNPNQQTGPGGTSLETDTANDWTTFLNDPSNPVNVTTIGIGDGIIDQRLEEVDLDADPDKTPLRVDDFDDLVDTLLDVVIGGLVDGNVLLGEDNASGGGDDDLYGADGPGQILSIEINGFTYTWDGVLDGDEQLTDIPTEHGGKLTFNFATGAWSYQAGADVDGDKTESFDYVIVDNDGDPSTATLTIHVEDTGPVEGYVDEDNLPDGIDDLDAVTDVATGSVADLVVGPDAGSHFTLSSDTSGVTPASAGGVALVYSVSGDTLTATAGPAGPVVFTLQVLDDGSYTFNLEQSLDHPLDGSDDDQLLTLDFTSILQANDGSDPLTLVGDFLIHVEDDVPMIDVGRSGQDAGDLNTQDAQTIGLAVDTATSDFSGAFTATPNHGADGPGTVTWSYSMVLLVAEGTFSGLSSDGDDIYLYQNGSGQIVGSTANSEGGVSLGNTIFTLSVDSGTGVVTLIQRQEIDHDLPGDTSNYDAQEAVLGAGLVGLKGTATITDYDQDTDSDSLTLDLGGKVLFDDDGPSISLGFGQNTEKLNTQDAQTIGGASDSDTDSFSSAFSIVSSSFGADGPGSISASYALVLLTTEGSSSGLSSDGATIYLYEDGGVIYGSTAANEGDVDPSNTIFTLSVNGSGQVTLTQHEEIDHSLPGVGSNYDAQEALLGNNLVGLQATVTITDDDGDSASDSKTLDLGGRVAFDDHGPSISVVFGTAPNPSLNTQDAETIGGASDTDSGSFSGAFVVTPNHGADGPGTVTQTYSLNLLAGGTGPLASGMNSAAGPIYLYKIGGEIIGSSSDSLAGVNVGNTIFSLAVDAGTGQVTLTQFQEISHDLPGVNSNYSNQEEVLLAGKIGLTLTATITDGDGDFATADKTLDLGGKIAFDDDGPSTSSNLGVQLDDDALSGGIAGGPGGTDDADSVNTTGTLGHDFGADGAGTVKWVDSGAPGGFTYQASPDGSQLLVKQGSTTVLTLTLNTATGAYTVTQNNPIQHDNANLENNQSFTLTYQVTDKDGDTATGSLSVNVDDDTPVAQSDTAVAVAGQPLDVNAVFVLDFSGSIDNTELNQMLEAVRAAAQELFNGASDVNVQIVAFSGTALSYPVYSDFASFSALIDSINPADGGTRPFNGNTDFTAAIEVTMADYTPISGWSNQVFFISDGNPNEQLGSGGNSLEDDTASDWADFINANDLNVTTIGVGGGIDEDRLQDVDLDGSGSPILVGDFDDLIDTLLDAVTPDPVEGSVLLGSDGVVSGDDDAFGADGPGRIASIEINGTTYTWDGVLDGDQQLTDIPTEWGGTLSFNFASGAWSYQPPALVDGDKVESFDYVIIDKDGDPSPATLTIHVEDPAPVIGKVDEDELPGGITDNDAQTTTVSGSLVDLLVGTNSGQFGLDNTPTGLPALTSGGVAITYHFSGNIMTAKAGLLDIFTLEVETDGSYTFSLLGPLDHPDDNNDDNEVMTLNLTGALAASDGVNPLPLAGSLLIQVEDDVPIAFTPVTALLVDQVAGTRSITESLRFEDSAGADGPDQVNFSIVEGTAARDASGNLLSMNGQQLYLFYGSDQSIIEAKTSAGGTLAYRIDMDASTDSYTLTTYGPIANGSEVSATNLTGVGGGNVRYKGLIDMGGTNFDALLSTTSGESVNTNSTEIGISGGNSFSNGEQLRIDLVNGLVTTANTVGFTYTNHNTTNRFAQKLAWVSPSGSGTATLIVSVILADDDLSFIGDAFGETTRNLSTSNIRVFAIEGGVEVDKTGLVTLTDLGSSIRIAGMQEGWWYEVTSTNNFSAVQIEGGNAQTFKLGFFEYDQASTGQPINLSHNIIGIDGDGDSVSSTLKATLVPDSLSVDGGAGIDNLVGTAQADYLFGNGGNDTLSGLAGNDILSGGTGDDLIIGGLGNDVLAGGAGADTFRWLAGDTTGADKVLDFKPSEGDKLDLTQLLVGESYNAGSLDDFLSFSVVDNSTVISIAPTGAGAPTTSIELNGFNVAVEYGVTPGGGGIISAGADTATVINGLLGDNALQVA